MQRGTAQIIANFAMMYGYPVSAKKPGDRGACNAEPQLWLLEDNVVAAVLYSAVSGKAQYFTTMGWTDRRPLVPVTSQALAADFNLLYVYARHNLACNSAVGL